MGEEKWGEEQLCVIVFACFFFVAGGGHPPAKQVHWEMRKWAVMGKIVVGDSLYLLVRAVYWFIAGTNVRSRRRLYTLKYNIFVFRCTPLFSSLFRFI